MNIIFVRILVIVFGLFDLLALPLLAAIETAFNAWVAQSRLTISEIKNLWRDGIE